MRSLLIGILLLTALSPVTAQEPPRELHEALVGEIRKLNPLFASANPVDRDITALIYEGLTTVNEFGEIVPDLAQDWTVSRDGLTYVVRLRQDVLWQDGLPFTSADVAYTFRTIRSTEFPGDPELSAFWRTVEINVLDEFTLRFRLVQPLASFPEQLRQGIVPAHVLANAPIAELDQIQFNLSPIGTGPYQIENIFADGGRIIGVSLRVAPNYRLRPEGMDGYALDRIVFRTFPSLEEALEAYRNGVVNSIGHNPPSDQLNDLVTANLYTTLAPGVGVLIYNWEQDELAYFRDQRFRLAMAYGTDRATAVENAFSGRGIVADSPIMLGSWAYNPAAQYPALNIDEAQRLLESVSFEPFEPPASDDEEETPSAVEQRRDFTILVLDDPGIAGIAFEVASQWNALGFTVTLEMVDFPTLMTRLESGDFDTALVEYSLEPAADPDQFAFWHEGQDQNYGSMADRTISTILAQARRDPNNLHRKDFYDDFQTAFTSRAPALVMYYPLFTYVVDARIEGIQLDFMSTPSDRFRTIKDWRFS